MSDKEILNKITNKLRQDEITVFEAIEEIRTLLVDDNYNRDFIFYLAKLLARVEDGKEEALSYFDELISDEARDDYLIELAMLKEKTGDYKAAEKIYIDLIQGNRSFLLVSIKLVCLYCATNEYEKAFNVLINMKCNSSELDTLGFFIAQKLGLNGNVDYNKLENYSHKQIVKYSYKLAISHIARHQYTDENKGKHSKLLVGIDIPDLYDRVSEKISEATPIHNGWVDTYHVKMDEDVGTCSGRLTRFLKVPCISGTKNIISIYPELVNELYLDNVFYRENNNNRKRTRNN